MSKQVNVAIIGCGMFGAEIALKAKESGLSVVVYEARKDILSGASANNQNRLHLGFHYPRDLETGKQCIRGFDAFKRKYSGCIEEGFLNAYFIASQKSLTSPESFLKFCDQLGVAYSRISLEDFPVKVQGVDLGILCEEVVYDCKILRDLVWQRLREENISVFLNERVTNIQKNGAGYRIESQNQSVVFADVVINASYSDINSLTQNLGYEVPERLFEYTVVPIIECDMPKVGVTIMDGPFMTILPYGQSDRFLLYNVDHTVISKKVATHLDQSWLSPETGPFAGTDKENYFNTMIKLCKPYIPALEHAKLVGFLEGPRMVLAKKDASDERPSIITSYDESYFTVFAGKIDHAIWVAEDIGSAIQARFNK